MGMKKLTRKLSATMLAITMMVGAVTYPTKEAKAGVVVASIGGIAGDGTGAIILPAGVAIAMMFGGVGTFIFGCYAFLDKIEVGDMKSAAIAFSVLFLDKGVENQNAQNELRMKLMNNYKDLNMNENDADYLAQIIIHKTSKIKVAPNTTQEVLFSNEELSQVVDSISANNAELAQKLTEDFTKSSMN